MGESFRKTHPWGPKPVQRLRIGYARNFEGCRYCPFSSKEPSWIGRDGFQLQSTQLWPFNQIQTETESKKKSCVDKGWRIYRNKDGEEVKLRHVLEKVSVWVTEIIKIVDMEVSFDKSGHAALPWGIVKFIITVGRQISSSANARFPVFRRAEFTIANDATHTIRWWCGMQAGINDINVFGDVVESIESISGLITRCTVIEMLYLREDSEGSEVTLQLRESITKLYAAILLYLAKAKAYFSGPTLSMCRAIVVLKTQIRGRSW
jgi:hypothetical protein